MGGLVGRAGQWTYFDRKWSKMLRSASVRVFHTKKWKDGDGDFAGWSRDQRAELIVKANDVVKNVMCGFSIMLRQLEYDEFYKC
jgi:hypothetical protein